MTLSEAYRRWRETPTEEAKQAVLEALAEAVERRDQSRYRNPPKEAA
jgi:cytidylate kinase